MLAISRIAVMDAKGGKEHAAKKQGGIWGCRVRVIARRRRRNLGVGAGEIKIYGNSVHFYRGILAQLGLRRSNK